MYDFKLFAMAFHTHSFNSRIFESSASSLSAIGKARTGNVHGPILELLECVEEAERRMIALPIMSFALDQWRAFRWVATPGEARCMPQKIASPELGRVPIFSRAARRAQTLASLLYPLASITSALRCIASLSR
jgi:hypothetical protein